MDMGLADSGTDRLIDTGLLLWPGTRFHLLNSYSTNYCLSKVRD